MKTIKKLSAVIIFGLALIGCTSTNKFREVSEVPYKVEKIEWKRGNTH